MPILKELIRYPLKSCMGEYLETAVLKDKGLEWDRNWALFDEKGQVVTGRTHPFILDVRPVIKAHTIEIYVKDQKQFAFNIAPTNLSPVEAHVFSYEVKGYEVSTEANQWFSEYLGKKVKMLFAGDLKRRVLALSLIHI